MDFDSCKSYFDFDNNDYFYHITGDGNGKKICEDGLLVDGSDTTNGDNMLYSTTIPITPRMFDDFDEVLDEELYDNRYRPTNQCVIIGASKGDEKNIVTPEDIYYNEHEYSGIIDSSYIMGYFNKDKKFKKNENYQYGTPSFDDSINFHI